MQKKQQDRSLNDVLTLLGSQRFDVGGGSEGARKVAGAANSAPGGAVRVSKFGCAAEIGSVGSAVSLTARPGVVIGGEISRLVDKGYQKFLKTSRLEIPATADHLRSLHQFTTELNAATGEMSLYNASLGTTSDRYVYDRVAGRPDDGV